MPTIDLNVDGFTADLNEWTKVGSSPWLDAEDASHIVGPWEVNDAFYTFEDMPPGTVMDCWMYVRVKGGLNANLYFYNHAGDFIGHLGSLIGLDWTVIKAVKVTPGWDWDTQAKINNARLKIRQPSLATAYVDHIYLRVTYRRAILKVAGSHRVGLRYVGR